LFKFLKSINILLILFFLFLNAISAEEIKPDNSTNTDTAEKTESISDELSKEGQKLDEEINFIYKKINDVIVKYKLLQLKDIRLLPYRTVYITKDNYIEVEKYEIARDYYNNEIMGINKKISRIFFSGDAMFKVECEISEQLLDIGYSDRIIITDPSPLASGTDDMMFTQIKKNKMIVENKKLGEIKNDEAAYIRNNIKKEFIIPHITFLFDSLLSIADTYYKGIKDKDSMLSDFLKKSANY
jgi:hypothetical protein